MKLFVVLCTIFMHIFNDFYLQGCLANLKCKSWWQEEIKKKTEDYAEYEEKFNIYRYDYIAALIVHGMSWSFCVMLPIAWMNGWCIDGVFVANWLFHSLFHAYIDDKKANKEMSNLVVDQIVHFIQLGIIWLYFLI